MNRWNHKKGLCFRGCLLVLGAALLLAVLVFPVASAQATTLIPLSLEDMSRMADRVVVVTAQSVWARRMAASRFGGRESIETVTALLVSGELKGTTGAQITLVTPGGRVGDLTMTVAEMPVFTPGETSVLFLDAQGRVIGGQQGKLTVVDGRVPALRQSLAAVKSRVARALSSSVEPGFSLFPTATATGAPLITSISPGSASAGTGTRVTITGSGFGAVQGTGKVEFFYRSGSALMPAPVVSWSDTSIVCVVPTASVSGYPGSAGSGPVAVTNSSGVAGNGYDFHVTFGYGGVRRASNSCSYRVNANCADTAAEDALFDAGALAWNPLSSFKFVDAGSSTARSAVYNGANEVFWTTDMAGGVLATATSWSIGSTIVENDISFNDNYLWGDGSAGSYDVQSIATHELGHWLNLRDLYGAGDSGKVMYGFGWAGMVKRTLHADDAAGIVWIYGGGTVTTTTTLRPTTTTTRYTRPTYGTTTTTRYTRPTYGTTTTTRYTRPTTTTTRYTWPTYGTTTTTTRLWWPF